jgi:hypothetical protein
MKLSNRGILTFDGGQICVFLLLGGVNLRRTVCVLHFDILDRCGDHGALEKRKNLEKPVRDRKQRC